MPPQSYQPTTPVTPPTPSPAKRRSWFGLVGLLLVVLVGLFVYSQKQAIYDYIRLYNYEPSSEVTALASTTSMTKKSEHIFYVNRPQVQGKDDFNASCPIGSEETNVLGCYLPQGRGIFIYNVTDPQLKGVKEVTAAHEMLHGAYDRLSAKERQRIDGLLQDYYANSLKDERLLGIIESYKKTEPNDIPNEMHSIFGTEIAVLPPALEDYYKQYFNDRQVVVRLAANYQAAFTSRKAQIATYDAQLATLKDTINAAETSLEGQAAALATKRTELNAFLASNDTATYNAQVAAFNAQVQAYNNLLAKTKQQINQYNSIVEARNAIALETQNLAQELNSRVPDQAAQ
ncbi:MAG: hypothetical protein QG553_439 [Patescibacteria group bacterium]|nr:hypothetical protein [Patescibacteria group bacterium]